MAGKLPLAGEWKEWGLWEAGWRIRLQSDQHLEARSERYKGVEAGGLRDCKGTRVAPKRNRAAQFMMLDRCHLPPPLLLSPLT